MPDAVRRAARSWPQAPTYAVLGLLAVALAFVTVYVLASNSISDKQGQDERASRRARADPAADGESHQLHPVRAARPDAHRRRSRRSRGRYRLERRADRPLEGRSANTSLQTLNATRRAGTSAAAPAGSGSSLLGSTTGPAIELTGCTKTQDDVARLMSRLRLVDGVTRVTLGNSQKPTSAQASTASPHGRRAAGGRRRGCGANAPTFDLVMRFKPLATAVRRHRARPAPRRCDRGTRAPGHGHNDGRGDARLQLRATAAAPATAT